MPRSCLLVGMMVAAGAQDEVGARGALLGVMIGEAQASGRSSVPGRMQTSQALPALGSRLRSVSGGMPTSQALLALGLIQSQRAAILANVPLCCRLLCLAALRPGRPERHGRPSTCVGLQKRDA